MEILNERETLIFRSAETLLNVSTQLREISPETSKLILCLSDSLLKGIEKTESVCNDETCPDCGGMKQDNKILFENPENKCHGHKADGSGSMPQPAASTISSGVKNEIKSLIDEIKKGL